MLQCGNIL